MKKLALVVLLGVLSIPSFAVQLITIGSGGVTGTYYPTGGAICRLVNKIKKKTGILCSVESTNGSVYNIKTIKNSELDFGIAQSDIAYEASKGIGKFEGNKVSKLRTVMAIYPELFTLVTRKDSNINDIMDIKGKRINLGNSGSGNESTALAMFNVLGIKKTDLAYAGALSTSEMTDALKNNKIDGYFYMVGHPTANIKDVTNAIDVKLVPITGAKIDKFVQDNSFYAKDNIPGEIYKGNPADISTFGVKALLVTSADQKDEVVYSVVKQVFENFDALKNAHPVFTHITKKSLLEGLSAPLHNGAKKYFKEIGLIK
ncbi:TAXI family TRAP transporter solute-binding subunit [Arcobacter sp.]|uniref:TAXI family TRAP transporter solute-binding subunit n=1 Tax=Arcobacter sp. TaxID=1872629 RepID=UPI003D13CBF5